MIEAFLGQKWSGLRFGNRYRIKARFEFAEYLILAVAVCCTFIFVGDAEYAPADIAFLLAVAVTAQAARWIRIILAFVLPLTACILLLQLSPFEYYHASAAGTFFSSVGLIIAQLGHFIQRAGAGGQFQVPFQAPSETVALLNLNFRMLTVARSGSESQGHLLLSPLLDDEQLTQFLNAARNITELKEAGSALEEELAMLKTMMDGAKNVHLVCLDRDFNYLQVNDAYAGSCGYQPAEMIGKNYFTLYPDAENEAIFVHVRDTGQVVECHDKPFLFPDQPERGLTYWDWTLTPVTAGEGLVRYLVLVLAETTRRKQAEDRLKESVEQSRLSLEAGGLGRWEYRFDTGEVLWDKRSSGMWGLPGKDVIPYSEAIKLVSEDDRDAVDNALGQAVTGVDDGVYDKEFRVCWPDGSIHWIYDHGRVYFEGGDDNRKAARFIGVSSDITERKHHEEQLSKLARLYAMLSRVNEAIVRARSERVLYFDVCRIVADAGGYPLVRIAEMQEQQVVAVAWGGVAARSINGFAVESHRELNHGAACLRANEPVLTRDFNPNLESPPWRDAAATHGVRASAAFPLRKEGKAIAVLTLYASSEQAFDAEELALLHTLSSDLSYALDNLKQEHLRAQIEQALRESQARLRITFDRAGVGIVELDVRDRLLAVNDRACEILGRSREELLTMTISALTHADDRARSSSMNSALYEGKSDRVSYETRYQKNGGTFIWGYATVSAIRDEDGRCLRCIATIEDISERKRAEAALQLALANLREADRRKDEFLAMLAHELRNPMAAISTAAALLALPGVAEDKCAFAKNTIKDRTQQLSRLVDDLLDVSRMTTGKVRLKEEVVELSALIEAAVQSTAGLFKKNSQQLIVRGSDALRVLGDPIRLEQAVANLLSNASKYTQADGTVTVEIAREGMTGVIRVQDNGCGIPPCLLLKIFDLFEQADTSLDRTPGGLGVGLTIAKKIIEMHCGTISAASEGPGKGSVFEIRLPLTVAGPALCSKEPQPYLEPGLQILIIEDQEDAARCIAATLEHEGHAVRMEHDGNAGLRAALQIRPDVILLDLGLPGLNGYQVARTLRRRGLADTLIIAISGYGRPQDFERSRACGIDHHLLKPVDLLNLRQLLARYQQRKEARPVELGVSS